MPKLLYLCVIAGVIPLDFTKNLKYYYHENQKRVVQTYFPVYQEDHFNKSVGDRFAEQYGSTRSNTMANMTS